jgi:hypothetical protein
MRIPSPHLLSAPSLLQLIRILSAKHPHDLHEQLKATTVPDFPKEERHTSTSAGVLLPPLPHGHHSSDPNQVLVLFFTPPFESNHVAMGQVTPGHGHMSLPSFGRSFYPSSSVWPGGCTGGVEGKTFDSHCLHIELHLVLVLLLLRGRCSETTLTVYD